MKRIKAILPWSGGEAFEYIEVREHWAERLGGDGRFLPDRVGIYGDAGVPASSVEEFVDEASRFFLREMAVRSARVRRMAGTGHFEPHELEELLTAQRHRQSWAIYFTENGGLPMPDSPDGRRGVIPCSSMRNHGVGWLRGGERIETWLLTARKPGEEWDMDSDVGHESAHAAFAPVPLFVEPGVMENVPFSLADVRDLKELRPEHLVRLLYFYSELAVVAIRGESRPTHTRLPIGDPEEVFGLVAISEELFPDSGFAQAKRACERANAHFDLEESDAIFDLATPVLRLLPRLNVFVNAVAPPTVEDLKDAVKLAAA